jgi:hypothetical protein
MKVLTYSDAGASKAVDLYNSFTGIWTTAELSVARYALVSASAKNMAFFSGGNTASGSALAHHLQSN